jgi:hypothetical protein
MQRKTAEKQKQKIKRWQWILLRRHPFVSCFSFFSAAFLCVSAPLRWILGLRFIAKLVERKESLVIHRTSNARHPRRFAWAAGRSAENQST